MSKSRKKTFIGKIKTTIRNIKRSIIKDNTVALVRIDGIIMDSSNFPMTKNLIKSFKEVEERDMKVLVLRINSPGGTVGASQEIYDALVRLKDKGIKIVASYGEVCASGGVYVGCVADYIIANAGTITGSIGVIVSSSNFKELYEKIGIKSEVVKSGPYKDILSTHRALTAEEKELLQGMIDNTYDQFVEVVSQNRNIPTEDVKKFADGRIFTGKQALELGLVDKTGTLKEAIYYAAELVGIEGEPKVVNLTIKKPMIFDLLSSKLQTFELLSEYSGMPMWLMPKIK